MNSPVRLLETGIVASQAELSPPPALWSYSSLKAVATCPRRYGLERASYPGLWTRVGYPTVPNAPALFGNVVHGSLEAVVKALADAGVESPHTEAATMVFRGLGGLTSVVERATSGQLATLEGNIRLSQDQQRRIARDLEAKIPDARARVQTYLSRTKFVASQRRVSFPTTESERGQKARLPFSDGSHAEVELIDSELRLRGHVDLLSIDGAQVNIVDYKTGIEADSHVDQLRLYALLWTRDAESNPTGSPVSGLTAAYLDHDVTSSVPTVDELNSLVEQLRSEIAEADREMLGGAPTAKPSDAACRFCWVRQLCPDYWAAVAPSLASVEIGSFFDFEGVVGEQNGRRSWWLLSESGRPELLLRSASTNPKFTVGDRVRILGVRRDVDPEVPWPIGSMTASSEVFQKN